MTKSQLRQRWELALAKSARLEGCLQAALDLARAAERRGTLTVGQLVALRRIEAEAQKEGWAEITEMR